METILTVVSIDNILTPHTSDFLSIPLLVALLQAAPTKVGVDNGTSFKLWAMVCLCVCRWWMCGVLTCVNPS